MRASAIALLIALAACGPVELPDDGTEVPDAGSPAGPDSFVDRVVSFTPGENAGFGADKMPDVVFGPPKGKGAAAGSLDVVSLGRGGEIVLAFDDVGLVDGDGPDLIVFENAFRSADQAFIETGFVAVSEDGATWHEWPCEPENVEGGYPHCAGVANVLASPANGIDPTDPAVAGGDAFDLADLGVARARFVRIRDSGRNQYLGTSGGFDLDAIAVVNGAPLE